MQIHVAKDYAVTWKKKLVHWLNCVRNDFATAIQPNDG